MRKIAVLCVASLFLLSCVGIDSRLTVRDNGSGTLVLTYRVSQLVADLGLSSSDKGVIPLPLSGRISRGPWRARRARCG